MKPELKLAMLIVGIVSVWSLLVWLCLLPGSPERRAAKLAETALYASVDRPESVRILATSAPDSVFGREFVSDDERMAIAMSMMKINEKVMAQVGDLGSIDFEDSEIAELAERQMSAMSAMHSFVPLNVSTDKLKPFNGWKVKIEYEAESASGRPYHSERWFILDKNANCVVNSFEVPVI